MEPDRQVEIRLSVERKKKTVCVVLLEKTKHRGIQVQNFRRASELFGKLLYHWNMEITYENLSIGEK